MLLTNINLVSDIYYNKTIFGNKKIIIDGMQFLKDKAIGNTVYWRCNQRLKLKCKARVTTMENEIVRVNLQHNHY